MIFLLCMGQLYLHVNKSQTWRFGNIFKDILQFTERKARDVAESFRKKTVNDLLIRLFFLLNGHFQGQEWTLRFQLLIFCWLIDLQMNWQAINWQLLILRFQPLLVLDCCLDKTRLNDSHLAKWTKKSIFLCNGWNILHSKSLEMSSKPSNNLPCFPKFGFNLSLWKGGSDCFLKQRHKLKLLMNL